MLNQNRSMALMTSTKSLRCMGARLRHRVVHDPSTVLTLPHAAMSSGLKRTLPHHRRCPTRRRCRIAWFKARLALQVAPSITDTDVEGVYPKPARTARSIPSARGLLSWSVVSLASSGRSALQHPRIRRM
jgi:hypothetical protein